MDYLSFNLIQFRFQLMIDFWVLTQWLFTYIFEVNVDMYRYKLVYFQASWLFAWSVSSILLINHITNRWTYGVVFSNCHSNSLHSLWFTRILKIDTSIIFIPSTYLVDGIKFCYSIKLKRHFTISFHRI